MEINKILQGDCLELMKQKEDKSIDLILCDLPYGTTACSWDEIIPLDKLWEQYKRIIRNNGFIVLFGSQPFTTKLINSNIEGFSHQWIWEKEQGANPLLANLMPMKNFEDIVVFYNEYKRYDYELKNPLREYFYKILCYLGKNNKQIEKDLGHRKAEHSFYVMPKKELINKIGQKIDPTLRFGSTQFMLCTEETYLELLDKYNLKDVDFILPYNKLKKINDEFEKTLPNYPRVYNPQMIKLKKGIRSMGGNNTETLGVDMIGNRKLRFEKFPTSIIKFNRNKKGLHPTEKPIELGRYLIKTYTNKGDLVLDNTCGAGSFIISAKLEGRNFIGIELNKEYCKIAEERLSKEVSQTKLNSEGISPPKPKGMGIRNGRVI